MLGFNQVIADLIQRTAFCYYCFWRGEMFSWSKYGSGMGMCLSRIVFAVKASRRRSREPEAGRKFPDRKGEMCIRDRDLF